MKVAVIIAQSPAQDLLKRGGKTVDPNVLRGKFGVVRCPHTVI